MRIARLYLAIAVAPCIVGLVFSLTALAAPPEPCSLLTTAEVEQVVGKLKGQPQADKEGAAGWCNYEFVSDKDRFEIWVGPGDAFIRMRKDAKNPVSVKGLGDDAFITRGAHDLDYVDLTIKKGAVLLQLALKQTAADEAKLKTLGQKAMGRF